MKSNLISRSHLLRLLAATLFFISIAAQGKAQGLVKILENAPDGYIGSDVEIMPSGNYLFASSYNTSLIISNRATRHYLAEITPSGNSLQETEYNFIPAFAWWLRDQTFLRVQDDWSMGDVVHRFVRSDAEGDTLWTQTVTLPPDYEYYDWVAATVNDNGEVFACCFWVGSIADLDYRVIVVKFSPDGSLLWQVEHELTPTGIPVNEQASAIQHAGDGGCLMALKQDGGTNSTLLVWLNADGSLRWSSDTQIPRINDYRFTADSTILVLGYGQILSKMDLAGEILWSVNLYNALYDYPYTNYVLQAMIPAADGSAFIIGKQNRITTIGGNPVVDGQRLFVVKINTNGEVIWTKFYYTLLDIDDNVIDFKKGIQSAATGDLFWVGSVIQSQNNVRGPLLLRMDSTGVIFSNHLAGKLAYDQSNDCTVQANETGLPGWLLKLESGGFTQYGSTDPDGHYYFADVDTGALALSLYVQNYLWEGCSPTVNAAMPPDSSDYTLQLDMPVRALGDCPVMTVDLAAPFLRRCFDNTYALRCCNEGNEIATGAFAEVFFPPHLLLQNASHPYTQNGAQLTFQLGNVAPFECVDIQLIVRPDCDSTELGQAMCLSARVYPDTICAPPPGWSGALVEVSAACDGDSVRFLIQNTGTAPMNEALDFIIIDDHVMTREGNFNLDPDGQREETLPADGSTYRLLAEQEPNAPGAFAPSVAVEGCIPGPGNPFTAGLVVQWPNENGSPFADRDCHELVGAFDPNDKQAVPQGVDDEHFIYPNTPVDYLIQFQNTGTDTAFTVVLRDTLSPQLDPATLRPGASSHPYTWSLTGAGVLTFEFENILLPDSNVNEPASRGFVQFAVRQKPDLADGTLLENRAGIYFDFNAPVMTNTVFHTVMRDFVPTVGVSNPGVFSENALSIIPNPAEGTVWISLEHNNRQASRLRLADAFGHTLREFSTADSVIQIQRLGLPAGVYYVTLKNKNGQVQSGKIIWR